MVNRHGINNSTDAVGWEAGLVTPPLPLSSMAWDSNGCYHLRPWPFQKGPLTFLPTFPPPPRGGMSGDRSPPCVSCPPDQWFLELQWVAPPWSGSQSQVFDRQEGLPLVPPAHSKPHS